MIFTKSYFGKEKIDEITYEDVVKFFSEEQREIVSKLHESIFN